MSAMSRHTILVCLVLAASAAAYPSHLPSDGGHEGEHESDTENVVQLHIVFRHGERAPVDTFPTDPYKTETFSPYGWGQLTKVGRNSQYNQGKWLRKRYGKLFEGGYKAGAVEAWTTDVDRTKMSMGLAMAGMFPPQGDQVWNKELLWQPVPTNQQKQSEDKLLLVNGCPRFSEAVLEVHELPEVKAKSESHADLYSTLTKDTGMTVTNPDDVQDIYSSLKAEESYGLTLPEWSKDIYSEMAKVTAESFLLNVYTPELQRIKGGPLLKKILKDSEAASQGKSSKKLYAYAGHDSTISNLLTTTGVWDPQVPNYNIMAMFEVHKNDDKYGIKVFLKNSTTHEPFLLTIPGCTTLCPLDEVMKLKQNVLPVDLAKECHPKNSSYVAPGDRGP